MKQKILDIMDDKIFIEYYGIHGKGHAAEEIAQMMCDKFVEYFDDLGYPHELLRNLLYDPDRVFNFDPEQIENALNKLK